MSLCLVYFVGIFVDTKGPTMVLPLMLLARSVSMLVFLFIDDPNTWVFYVLAPFSDLSKYALIVSVQGYLYKIFPHDLRGIFSSLLGATSSLGLLMTKRLRGNLASHFGTYMPFIASIIVDTFLAVICLVLGSVGVFRSIDRMLPGRSSKEAPRFRRQRSKQLKKWSDQRNQLQHQQDEIKSTKSSMMGETTYGGL